MTRSTDSKLAKRALAAAGQAWCPYSGFRVGAALLDEAGNVHVGCNVENASYPEGSCAETAAIAAMILAGGTRIDTITVVGWQQGVVRCTPCGGCRQRIAEFADGHTRVLVLTDEKDWEEWTAADLLPVSFRLGR